MSARGVRVAHPRAERENYILKATPAAASEPRLWLLGSSMYSAHLAAAKGLPYVFAHHFSGQGTEEALAVYRSEFRPSDLARRTGDVPDRQRGGGRNPRRGNGFAAAEPADDGAAAHRPAARAARPRRGRRGSSELTPQAAGDRRQPGCGAPSSARPTEAAEQVRALAERVRRRRGDGQPGRVGAPRHRSGDSPGPRSRRWNCSPRSCSDQACGVSADDRDRPRRRFWYSS